jgi:hypothetical protein
MGDIGDWIQTYWFELGSLALQLGTLATLLWFARKALAVLAASPRHYEEPQTVPLESVSPEPARPYQGGLRGLIPMEPQPACASASAPARHVASAVTHPWRAVVRWLNTPMKSGATIPWRRVTRQLS